MRFPGLHCIGQAMPPIERGPIDPAARPGRQAPGESGKRIPEALISSVPAGNSGPTGNTPSERGQSCAVLFNKKGVPAMSFTEGSIPGPTREMVVSGVLSRQRVCLTATRANRVAVRRQGLS